MASREVNFDGLIGPTHNYSGLSHGNLASQKNARQIANPRQAALQGLEKMALLMRRGYTQGFFLPQQRPQLSLLRRLGFTGDDSQLIDAAGRQDPRLLSLVYSASSMWAANAATVTPSADSADGRIHFTPANLLTTPHRTLESSDTEKMLQLVFSDNHFFKVHSPLPALPVVGDEGAANHNRFCSSHGDKGMHVFVYGRDFNSTHGLKYPARQTLAASQAVARQHRIAEDHCLFLKQSEEAINAGAFHNDVVAVANESVLLYHQQAFAESPDALADRLASLGIPFIPVCVESSLVSLEAAVQSYLFNSQLLTHPKSGEMELLSPTECEHNRQVRTAIDAIIADDHNPIRSVTFMDLRQSMRNGGGPACLRLRVVMTAEELAACDPRFLLNEEKLELLTQWVNRHYRTELSAQDLLDPQFVNECYTTLDELTNLLRLPPCYDFQL